MRIEHVPFGDPCLRCGESTLSHRAPRDRTDYYAKRGGMTKRDCLGVDGEGFDSGSVYAYMACYSKTDEISHVENLKGIPTWQALDFLLDLPSHPLKFGFSLGYDYTKILQDVDNESLWKLARPEERQAENGPPVPILFAQNGTQYALNLLGNRLTVARMGAHRVDCNDRAECLGCRTTEQTILWDVFKFFQSSFITACLAWGVISRDEHDVLKIMKAKRPDFQKPRHERDAEWVEIKRYCGLECVKMAELAERLLRAHEEAGLKLKQYFGAGSTGAAMLDKMNARAYIRVRATDKASVRGSLETKELPATRGTLNWKRLPYSNELRHAIACAFFGGRFEISRFGPVRQPCYSYDISSAYPYAFTFLPCLVHGRWERISAKAKGFLSAVMDAHAACIRYELPYSRALKGTHPTSGTSEIPWGPFPFRAGKEQGPIVGEGDIVFPVTSGGGWIWRDEFLAGLAHYPNVEAREAWVYRTECPCRVLRHVMPENYKLRLAWGKEGKGIVVKLGQNSCYGKTAQTKGQQPPYQEFVWAGMTTSSCRAQLLHAMAQASHPDKILMLATDGIFSTERLTLARPVDTGTDTEINGKRKPLGGWEEKELPFGLFLIRPGIAFPLDEGGKAGEADFKARGIGKSVLHAMRRDVLRTWDLYGPKEMTTEKTLFYGYKSQVYHVEGRGEYRRTPRYGKFGSMKQVISFAPHPKRPATAPGHRFLSHAFLPEDRSTPYKPVLGEAKTESAHLLNLIAEKQLEAEQPDLPEELDQKEF